jgi:hypothetical protein
MPETISAHNMFSPGLRLEFSCIELVKIRASDKDLPVTFLILVIQRSVLTIQKWETNLILTISCDLKGFDI